MKPIVEDESARISFSERFSFWLENFISEKDSNKFKLLLLLTLFGLLVNALAYSWAVDVHFGTALFLVSQVLAAGCFVDVFTTIFSRLQYLFAILTGVIVFAVLVGFVNEQVMRTMQAFGEGRTKVACRDHTLILGWNESTVRVVCQLALLRRAYLMQNETWSRWLFPWTRLAPSTPLAAGKIVVLCNTKTKEEMDYTLREALLERGVSPKRTCVGQDVICRIGDPTEPHELLRVGAHRAIAVLTMMTDDDEEEEDNSNGYLGNAITLRVILALKSVILTQHEMIDQGKTVTCLPPDTFWEKFRCVLHLEASGSTIQAARFSTPSGRQVVKAMDLRHFVNAMMFTSAVNPKLPSLMLSLLDFDGFAFRAKDATQLRLVGMKVQDCALIWEDAIFCGVVDKNVYLAETEPDFNQGLACNPQRLITKNDRVIFIGRNAFPTRYQPTRGGPKFLGHVSRPPKRPTNVLVCGWRKQWVDGARLAKRVMLLVQQTAPGTNIVFVNMKSDFPSIVESAKDENGRLYFTRRTDTAWDIHGAHVYYVRGDSGNAETLRTVMRNPGKQWKPDQFETAIVLGTAAKPLPKRSQDLRMLSTYVLVHHIHREVFGEHVPLHVIGENQFDSTVLLTQAVTAKPSLKDMINTQALYARVLVQALAYPLMQPAIAQMFNDAPGNPGLRMFKVGGSMVPVGTCTFADITRTIAEHQEMIGAICIGVVLGDEQYISPQPDDQLELEEGDIIAVIERGEHVMQLAQGKKFTREWTNLLSEEDEPSLLSENSRPYILMSEAWSS